MSKKLAIIIICIAITLIGGVVAFFAITNSPPPPPPEDLDSDTDDDNNEQPDITLPTITVPESLELYVGDSSEFNIVVEDTNLEYEINHTISNYSVCDISDGNIIALSAGEATISTTLTVGEKYITKITAVKIYSSVTNVTCSLLTESNDSRTIYKNETYYAKFEFDSVLLSIPNFSCSNNVEFNLYDSANNYFIFEFEVNSFGNFGFNVCFLNLNKDFNYTCYDYITNIDATFNNAKNDNDVYKLFLFNREYLSNANADGYFDVCDINIALNQYAYEDYEINISSPVAQIIDNKIYAKSDGIFELTIKSNDNQAYQKSFNFIVETILPTIINSSDLTAKVNEVVTIEYEILPIYSIYENLEITCNNTSVIINQNNIKSSTIGTFDITLKINNIQKCIKFDVSSKVEFNISINQSIINNYGIVINKNIVSLEYSSTFILAINFEISAENLTNLKFSICATSNGDTFEDFSYDNSRILFEVDKPNNLLFTITCPSQPSLMFEIFVNIN